MKIQKPHPFARMVIFAPIMESSLFVNEEKQLIESNSPVGIKWAAKIISYIFHPAFVPVYLVVFMLFVHPYLFAGLGDFNKSRVLIMALMMYAIFPIITVLLLKGLKFIESIQLHTQKDRVIPLVACGIWYGWICYVWWNSNKMNDALVIPRPAVQMALAIFLGSWVGLMLNIIMKISLHAIAVGVMLAFMCLLAFTQELNFGIYLSIAIFITGLVCTARLIVSNHTAREVYCGLLAGMGSMIIAWQF
jgi:hypothetical protein